jgi:hypothetical protein
MRNKFLKLALIFVMFLGSLLSAYPTNAQTTEVDPPPCAFPIDENFFFWNDPMDPSIFDWITFGLDGCIPPPNWVCDWNFGDGTTATGCFIEDKQFKTDGDYAVNVVIKEIDSNNSASITETVLVRTHDVAIAKFTVPQSARVGQTRQIGVYVRNNRYPENVQVEFYKSTVNGYAWVGTLTQYTPVRPANRTTTFSFNYTFTAEDAYNGKVTFRAMAFILDARDALQADNEAISLPTRVTR